MNKFAQRALDLRWLAAALLVLLPNGVSGAESSPLFVDVTAQSRISNTYAMGGFYQYAGGGAVGDFDNDGWQDVFIPGSPLHPDRLFLNKRNGSFRDVGEQWGLTETHLGVGVAVGDYNGDGWLDIFMTCLGLPGHPPVYELGQHKLYHNVAGSHFTEVAEEAGVNWTGLVDSLDFGATFGDHDLDGDLDLFVAGYTGSYLFRNNSDGTFAEVTEEAGLLQANGDPLDHGLSASFVDMNGDRYPELLFVADEGRSRYFRNNGDGTFTDMTSEAGTGEDEQGMGQACGDIDGDLRLDWYVTSIFEDGTSSTGNKLYLNRGNDVFDEVAPIAEVDDGGFGWGTVAVDFDHDGWLDLAATNASDIDGGVERLERYYVWTNDGDGTFTEWSEDADIRVVGADRGLVHLDYDNDGDQDLIIFRNEVPVTVLQNIASTPGTHWLRVFLDTGQRPDLAPNGFGSTVTVEAGGKSWIRAVYGKESYLSKSELSAHFGLGTAELIDSLRVEWPNGEMTVLTDVEPNRTLTIQAPVLPGGLQRPGDGNQDGDADIADVVFLLLAVFAADGPALPCETDEANEELLDATADGSLDTSDAIYELMRLFRAGPSHALGSACVRIEDCPAVCE